MPLEPSDPMTNVDSSFPSLFADHHLGNLADIVFRISRQDPDRCALRHREHSVSYGDLADQIEALAGAFQQMSLKPDMPVAILLYNTPSFVIGYFALLGLGIPVLPLNTRLTAPEINTILNDSGAQLLISSLEFHQILRGLEVPSLNGCIIDTELVKSEPSLFDSLFNQLPRGLALYQLDDLLERKLFLNERFPIPQSPNTLAALIYTSGTTGVPKGVMLSHRNLAADATANVSVIEATASDRFITISPLFHVFGQTNVLLSALMAGGELILIRKFTPRSILDAIQRYRVTFMAAVPTMYLMMLSHLREKSFELSSLRVCHSGASPMAVDTFHAVEKAFGAPVQEGYGLSEASSIVCSNPLKGARKPGSVGLPLPGVQIRVLRDDHSEAATGEIGELHIQGDIVMLGYYQRPLETVNTLISLPDGQWLRTRDLGYKDMDGYLYIVDRADDLINIAGVKVYPREIEEVLFQHPAIQAVAVTGFSQPLHDDVINAFVVFHPGKSATHEALQDFCKQQLADYKLPKHYEFVEAIPQGATGKVLRHQLRPSVCDQSA